MKKLTFLSALIVSIFYTVELSGQSLPSASAAQMTRYGNVSVNESSGRVTTSIPIYTFQAGNLSMPIGVSYVGNGVKVDQQSSWVGTNWSLNAGGVVTRVVHHIADEVAENRLTAVDIENAMHDPNDFQYISELIDGDNLTDDIRPDIFSFSFPGYSGSFYLNNEMQPVLMVDNTELKISLINLNTIEIITPEGLKYYFGGDLATEATSSIVEQIVKNSVDAAVDFSVIPKSITAYYLYKIVHPLGDEILIDYLDYGDQELTLFQGDIIRALTNDPFFQGECNTSQEEQLANYKYKGKIYNRKKISRIYSTSSDYEVQFTSSDLLLHPELFLDPQYDDRILNGIHVYNNLLNQFVKNVKLTYQITPHRFFLEEVAMNNDADISSNTKCSVYKMEYDEPEALPKRFSTLQDPLGYYSGKEKELSLTTEQPSNNLNDFVFASKGSLRKINYPSGGYSLFEYETAEEVVLKNLVSGQLNVKKKYNENILIESDSLSVNRESLYPSVDEKIVVNINIDFPNTQEIDPMDGILVEVKDTTTGVIQTETVLFGEYNSSFNKKIVFAIGEVNTYTVKLAVLSSEFTSSTTNFNVNATVAHQMYIKERMYGIRLKRVSDYTDAIHIARPMIKRYYYKRANHALINTEDFESAVVTYDIPKENRNYYLDPCCPSIYGMATYSYTSLQSDPFSSHFAGADNQVSYKYVTVSLGGDSFQEGGVEKQFRIEEKVTPNIIYTPDFNSAISSDLSPFSAKPFLSNYADNTTILNGVLFKETHFKNLNNGLYIVKETDYMYDITPVSNIQGAVLTTNTEECISVDGLPENITVYPATLASYNNYSYKFNLTNVKVTDHTGNLISVLNPLAGTSNTIVSSQVIEYGQLKGKPTKITSKNSDNEYQITKNYYLTDNDINVMNYQESLSASETQNYQSLISQNRISTPIQTETYFKKETSQEYLRSRQRVLYADFNGLLLPKEEQTSKLGSLLETRSSSHKYDNQGYVLEMSSDNNVTTSIIYGYKDKKVLAQLVNVKYDDILTINNLHNLSNLVTDEVSMNALETALDQLRLDLPNGQITTYVYNKLGQLSSMKDTRGYKISYQYDDCYRLKLVKDHLGNVLKNHEYNIITNNN